MKWFWKVRCYLPNGHYHHCQIETERVLNDIAIIQDFYKEFTGCKMLLEGMSETVWEGLTPPLAVFQTAMRLASVNTRQE